MGLAVQIFNMEIQKKDGLDAIKSFDALAYDYAL